MPIERWMSMNRSLHNSGPMVALFQRTIGKRLQYEFLISKHIQNTEIRCDFEASGRRTAEHERLPEQNRTASSSS